MRKAAGLKRGSRKKHQQEENKSPSNSEGSVNSSSSNGEGQRRKPTSEEAGLTAKNYRLAKELSELRVRHRDETKNVTRLTMENMNLASRCREAISHVAMLKKELAMHQRRAAEALAAQRQQSQRSGSNVVSDTGIMADLSNRSSKNVPSSTDVAVEMDRMDRILAAHAPPPPPPRKGEEPAEEREDASLHSKKSFGDNGNSPASSSNASTPSVSPKNSPGPTDSNEEDGVEKAPLAESDTKLTSPSLFPRTASPRPKHRENYNDVYPDDVSPHKASHESSLPSVPDEEGDSENVPMSHAREEANKKLSSIDAFEASFDTAFPATFTSPREDSPPKTPTSEIYNPFFPSPAKKKVSKSPPDTEKSNGGVPAKERKWGTSLRARSPVSRKGSSGKGGSEEDGANDSMPKMDTTGRQATIEDVDEDRSLFDAKSPERSSSGSGDSGEHEHVLNPASSPKIVSRASIGGYSGDQFRTPPHFSQRSEEPAISAEQQPRRPEKTISASARARYEKALQPRGYPSRVKDNASMSVDTTLDTTTKDATNSPSTVLRRLQQRRAKSSERYQTSSPSDPAVTSSGAEVRRARSMRSPVGGDDSPFDEGDGGRFGRNNSGRNVVSGQNGNPFRATANEAENSYQRSRSFGSAGKKLSPTSMNAEIRALDAMASSSTYQSKRGELSPTSSDSPTNSAAARLAALKQRRGVKQPVSYAEPPLNTKIRRGDVYFRKPGEGDDEDSSAVVSPTNSDGSRGRSSRSRSGASPDEVLKDLAGPATVRS